MSSNILISGSHRSGSTWTGRVISKAKGVRYVHEPFNIDIERENSPIIHWFQYVSGEDENDHRIEAYLNSFLRVQKNDVLKELKGIKTIRKLQGFTIDFIRKAVYKRTVMKDPIAIMSVEWMAHRFEMDVVILIRHPAAFVASLKVKKWAFDFSNFLDQPLLINTLVPHYREDITEACKSEMSIIKQGILLWNIIHSIIGRYSEKYKNDWYFVKHEDLSRDPAKEFENMFKFLGLTYSSKVNEYIESTSQSRVKGSLERDSKANIMSWKKRLSEDEIKKIKEGTINVWPKFYGEDEW